MHVITGEVLNTNQKMAGYERFTEQKQHRVSANQTVLPQDLYVHDPITQRKILKKWLIIILAT